MPRDAPTPSFMAPRRFDAAERILREAMRLFADKGYERTSIADIQRAAGLRPRPARSTSTVPRRRRCSAPGSIVSSRTSSAAATWVREQVAAGTLIAEDPEATAAVLMSSVTMYRVLEALFGDMA
jgi:hypothetical protein